MSVAHPDGGAAITRMPAHLLRATLQRVTPPPWKIKVVEPIALKPAAARRRALERAGFNTFLLRVEDALNDDALAQRARELVILYEGFPHYGGLAGHDIEALAHGIRESTDEAIVRHCVGQGAFLGELLAYADGDEPTDGLELVRLTIPRRVYTEEHLRYVADVVVRVLRQKELVPGLRMTYEPHALRFFQARFEPLGPFLTKAAPATGVRATKVLS